MTTTLEREEKQSAVRAPGLTDKAMWARVSATGGAAVWAGLAVLARIGVAHFGAIELMFLFAPLVIVPLGIELGRGLGCGGRLASIAQRIQSVAAALAVGALWIGPGRTAAALACGWLVVCMLVAGAGVGDLISASWSDANGGARATFTRDTFVRDTLAPATFVSATSTFGRTSLFVRVVVGVAYLDLAVGGAWLVASRWGMRPMGIQEPIGLLTAVHFHFAGFATAMIAAATLQFAERRGEARWLRWLVGSVIALPYLVAAGFVISPALKMVAGVFFSISVAGLAVFVRGCGRKAKDASARVLLQVAAGCVFAGMVLAGMYAVADFFGSDVLTIPQMARTHGVLNAVGFCMSGLLGWVVESSVPTSAKIFDR